MKRILAAFLAAVTLTLGSISAGAESSVDKLQGQGPADGEFKAWTKLLANGYQLKFYAKYLQPGQKVQFMVQNDAGEYEQIAWNRIDVEDLNADGSYKEMQNHIYFIRTINLKEGKNRVRILVDGEIYWGTKTYVGKTPPPSELSSLAMDPNICKIRENSRYRPIGTKVDDYTGLSQIRGRYKGNATAFPFAPTVLPTTGVLNVAMVLVDWEDHPGNQVDYDFYKLNADLLSEFYYMASEGKLEVRVHMSEGWFRIPGSFSDYAMTVEEEGQRFDERPKKQILYDAIVAASDADTDYTDIQVVIPAWPRGKTISEQGPHEFNFDWNAAMYTQERVIYDIAGAGDWFLNHTEFGAGPWFYYVHEMGHMLGIPHQSSEEQEFKNGTYERENSWWAQNPLNGFDVMANQDGAIKTLTAWLRWLPGWLDDDQVICVTADSIEDELFRLSPINEIGGSTEAVVVKLSDSMVIVIESRRWDERFDRPIIHSRDGIIAYTVDATKGSAQANQTILSPRNITNWLEVMHWRHSEELDGNFCEGDSVEVANLRITAERIGNGVDYVRISKTDNYVDPTPPKAGTAFGQVNTISNGCVFGPGADFQYWQERNQGN